MNFTEALKTVFLDKYADFSGRAARSEYWWTMLFSFGLGLVFQILAMILGSIPVISIIYTIITMLIGLALLVPGVAVYIRRMHDIGKSGPFLLLALVPFVNLYIIYLLAQPGEEGDNSFGANPLET